MSKLQDLIDSLCPNGVEFKPLGEVCEILDSQRKPVSKGNRIAGQYPYYGANGIQDYVNEYLFDGTFILVGEDGSVINADNSPIINWAEGRIWVNNHAHILAEINGIKLRYLYYALQLTDVSDIVRGTPPKLNQANLKNISIPIPPLAVQEEIVRILDRFSNYAAELQAELQARKEQYEYYRNLLLTFNPSACGCGTDDKQKDSVIAHPSTTYKIQWKKMGEIGTFYGGLTGKSKSDFTYGKARFISYMNVYSNIALNQEANEFVRIGENEKQNILEYGDAIFTGSSETPDECGMSSVVTKKPTEALYP